MAMFTCITCRVAFLDSDVQREHYKTDWHRYNLKRKVADLPPVTAENFQQRVLAQKKQEKEDECEVKTGYCALCRKHFGSRNSYANHLTSKKHRELETKLAEKNRRLEEKNAEKGLATTDSEPAPIVANDDDKVAEKNRKNLEIQRRLNRRDDDAASAQMSSAAAKAAPSAGKNRMEELFGEGAVGEEDAEMDSDVESVDSWEADALGLEECLFCSEVSDSIDDNIQHMTKTHSFFIPDLEYLTDLEGFITYLGEKVGVGRMCLWCNGVGKTFHSTKSVQQHMTDRGHCKILHEGEALLEYADFYDYRSSYPDYQEGEEEGDDDDDDDESVADGEDDLLQDEGYQLVLPSGATIGHRSLVRYYRQNLPESRVAVKTSSAVNKALAQYKALGWLGATGHAAEKKRKDMAFVQRWKLRNHMKIGMKANKFQPHFRNQVMF
ncbi:cytoplasmic 60S subunit biogenesis factor ZNF622-like isoform X2 [Tubulanus polymorphus]